MLRLEINIEAVKAGHPDAWRDVYTKYWRSLVWFFLNKDERKDDNRAEDLAQCVLIKIYDNRHKLISADHLRNMVYLIAKRELANVARGYRRHPTVDIDEVFDIQDEQVLEEQEQSVRIHELFILVMEELVKMNKTYSSAVIEEIENPNSMGDNCHYIGLSRARKRLTAIFGKRIYIH